MPDNATFPPDSPPTDAVNDECRVLMELHQTPQILQLVAGWSGTELALQSQLRQQFSDELVRAAVSLHELRRKAAGKFTKAASMWFDRRGLEQSTAEQVSHHKAARFDDAVWDLCCGIGGDAIAIAERCSVTAIDLNPAACQRTRWNAEAYGVESRLETRTADVLTLQPEGVWIHVDPDRRAGSEGKASRIEDYVPGLPELIGLMSRCRGGAIKVGPASNFGGKFPDAEIELISLSGECKEATVWFGELAGRQPFRATVLPSGESIAGHPLDAVSVVAPLGRYLYDPDPAVVRAGLIDVVAERLDLNRLDGAEEYLTSDSLVSSTFVHPFEVLAELPNNESDLRSWLRASDFGQVEIKCRHIRVHAETLRRRLPLPGNQPGVVILARLNGKARMICARRIVSG
ncbi:MAG: methyltransferase domain-containing protein [Planctomycetes bacterium]|nr:methyltransferase domain-containing protein [Planctomycetota bacterium]